MEKGLVGTALGEAGAAVRFASPVRVIDELGPLAGSVGATAVVDEIRRDHRFGAAVVSGDFSKVGWYSAAQTAGAIVGACLVRLHYLPHWRETPDADSKRACFCTAPAIRS